MRVLCLTEVLTICMLCADFLPMFCDSKFAGIVMDVKARD